VPSIALNIDSINAAAARIGRPDLAVTASEPVTCELLARLHTVLGLDFSALARVSDAPSDLRAAG
jgi:hypothetical protein